MRGFTGIVVFCLSMTGVSARAEPVSWDGDLSSEATSTELENGDENLSRLPPSGPKPSGHRFEGTLDAFLEKNRNMPASAASELRSIFERQALKNPHQNFECCVFEKGRSSIKIVPPSTVEAARRSLLKRSIIAYIKTAVDRAVDQTTPSTAFICGNFLAKIQSYGNFFKRTKNTGAERLRMWHVNFDYLEQNCLSELGYDRQGLYDHMLAAGIPAKFIQVEPLDYEFVEMPDWYSAFKLVSFETIRFSCPSFPPVSPPELKLELPALAPIRPRSSSQTEIPVSTISPLVNREIVAPEPAKVVPPKKDTAVANPSSQSKPQKPATTSRRRMRGARSRVFKPSLLDRVFCPHSWQTRCAR